MSTSAARMCGHVPIGAMLELYIQAMAGGVMMETLAGPMMCKYRFAYPCVCLSTELQFKQYISSVLYVSGASLSM